MAQSFGRLSAACGEGGDAQDTDCRVQGQNDDVAGTDLLGAFEDALAVDANMPGMDQRLRGGAAFDEPDAVEIAVDPHRLALEVG